MIAVSSCNNVSQSKPNTDNIATMNDDINTGKDARTNSEVNDSIINIRFPAGSISTTVSGKMKGINHPVTVLIPIKQGKQLIALITTEGSLANISVSIKSFLLMEKQTDLLAKS